MHANYYLSRGSATVMSFPTTLPHRHLPGDPLLITPQAFHSKSKSHLFNNSYPNPSAPPTLPAFSSSTTIAIATALPPLSGLSGNRTQTNTGQRSLDNPSYSTQRS